MNLKIVKKVKGTDKFVVETCDRVFLMFTAKQLVRFSIINKKDGFNLCVVICFYKDKKQVHEFTGITQEKIKMLIKDFKTILKYRNSDIERIGNEFA